MRKLLLSFLLFVSSFAASAQLTGTKTIPGDYASLTAAVADLNAVGVGAGGVIFDVAPGYAETLTGKITITATGTSSNQIVFKKAAAGANPVITSYTGTFSTPSTIADGMIVLAGSDYVTFDGIDLQEAAGNTTTLTVMEYGFGLFLASATDGAQNNTIRNCTITLNRLQFTSWTGAGYIGSVGIAVSSALNTANTLITPTAASGSNSFNKFYNNTIQNCNTGIAINGAPAASPYTTADIGNDIGGVATATGNRILNYGGGTGATNASAGIYATNQYDLNCSYNTINNNNGSGANHPNTLRGIYLQTATSASLNCNFNNLNIKGGGTTSQVSMIESGFGATPLSNTVNIKNNTLTGDYLTATSGVFYGIYNIAGTAATLNITDNNISNLNYSASGLTGSGALYPIYTTASNAGMTANINNNTISNIARQGTTGGTTIGIFNSAGVAGMIVNANGNNINNVSIDGAGTGSTMYGIQLSTGNISANNNTVSNLKCLKTTGTGAMYGIYDIASPVDENYNNNQVFDLQHNGTGTVYGIYANSTTGTRTVRNNIVYNISTGGLTVAGIAMAASSPNVFKNKVYNITSNSAAAPTVSGIILISVSTGGTANIYNNLIGNLEAPVSSTSTATSAVIRGINLAAASTTVDIFLYYNTIYLNASSSGANFGTAGIFHTGSTTSTSSNLTMRNNIIFNSSTPSGVGSTVAYRRSTSTAINYNNNSNRNLFYAGTPGANNLIFSDGTNDAQTLADYKTLAVTADQNSYTENVTFQSVTGSSINFLKFSTATPTVIESGGLNIAGITDDYTGTIRAGNPGYTGTGTGPDLGAWELEGIAVGGCSGTPPASTTVTTNAAPCANELFTLSLTPSYGVGFTYQWQSSPSGGAGTYTDISGATNSTLNTSASVTTFYRAVITCVSSGVSTNSTAVEVTIPLALNGSYTIDNTGSGNYISFAAAIADLNCRSISGPVTFNVTGGQTFVETTNLELTLSGTSANTISFVNAGGPNPVISRAGTTATNDYILKLTGVDYYIFDGIDFMQSGTVAADWVEYGIYIVNASNSNGSQHNSFKNGTVTLSAANSNTRSVYIQSAVTPVSTSGNNSFNKFIGMTIEETTSGYYIIGSSSTIPDQGNEIITEVGSNPSIIQNVGNGTTAGTLYGIYFNIQQDLRIENTEITNIKAGGTSTLYGIFSSTSTANRVVIKNNNLHDFSGAGINSGIYLTGLDTATIEKNLLYDFSTSGNASALKGIDVTGTGGAATIRANRIYALTSTGTTTTNVAGIDVATGINFVIDNNMISGLTASSSTSTSAGTKGIWVSGGSTNGKVKIYFNSIYLTDVATVAAYTSAGIYNSSTTPELDIKNNIVVNATDIDAIGTRVVAFWKSSVTDNVDNTSNNNIYYAGAPDAKHLIYFDGTNSAQSMATYRALSAISPAETFSETENVQFQAITAGIIRPNTTTPTFVESGAQPIAGFTLDFEGDLRNATKPDIGADEGTFTILIPPVPECVTYTSPANSSTSVCASSQVTLSWTPSPTGSSATGGYDVFFGTTPNPPFLINVSTNNTLVSVAPGFTYYWKVLAKNASGSATGCTEQSFTTLNPQVVTTVPGSRCGPGSVTLSGTGSAGTTLKWYSLASGGTALAQGNSFMSPLISTNTDFYLSAAFLQTISVGEANTTSNATFGGPTGQNTSTFTASILFDVISSSGVNIKTVDVYPTGPIGSTINIAVYASDQTTIIGSYSTTSTVSGTTTAPVKQVIPVNFSVPAGTGYIMRQGPTAPTASLIRYTTPTGNSPFPYSYPEIVLTGSGLANFYYYFFNWQVESSCESSRTAVTATINPASGMLAGTAGGPQICSTVSVPSVGETFYDNAGCDLINKVDPSGASPVSGMINSCVKIETGTMQAPNAAPYVMRHYDIEPATNAATATATITLYFKQSEFDNYNNYLVTNSLPQPPLPANPTDATGIANLLVSQFHGTGTAPGNYTGAEEIINPADGNIVWDATNSRWAVTFDVTGFSGFYVQTNLGGLPVSLINLKGEATGATNTISWTTVAESNNKKFVIERSINGSDFLPIGDVASKASNGNSTTALFYSFVDLSPKNGKVFYRLRQEDNNSNSKLSATVHITRNVKTTMEIVSIYPNPATTTVGVSVTVPVQEKLTMVVLDMTGRILSSKTISAGSGTNLIPLDVSSLGKGTYIIKVLCESGCESNSKFVKM